MNVLYRFKNICKAPWKSYSVSVSMTFVTASFISLMVQHDQIDWDKDGVVDWCIILVEMTLARFEKCWPLPTASLPEIP